MSSLIVEVCKVDNIRKHPNADRLSVVQVKGWNCIVGLDQYKAGELVVFVPPDSILPQPLIEKYNLEYLKKNGRTGTIKLRGALSQGLILDVPEGKWKEGDDVAEFLGITKWQPPEPAFYEPAKRTSKKRINPNFQKYTDIENIKHYPDVFQNGDMIRITEKIHGTNSRFGTLPIAIQENANLFEKISYFVRKYIFGQKYEFVYGSHNVQITNHSNRKSFYGSDVWGTIAERYNLAKIIPPDYTVYGEIYGESIQDLTYGLSGTDFVVFDVMYNGKFLDWDGVRHFCYMNNLKHVPQLYVGEYNDGIIQKHTSGVSVLDGTQIREGCVVCSLYEENDLTIGRKVLKSISEAYLLRKNGTEFK